MKNHTEAEKTQNASATISAIRSDAKAQSLALMRRHVMVQGQVQGVGFRPFIYRLALEHKLTGQVSNTAQGVSIEAQGQEQALQDFICHVQEKLPPLAQISHLSVTQLAIVEQEEAFNIIHSQGAEEGGHTVLISPDMSLCDQCCADMDDIHNKRYLYPFTNCTNCGPRYTITHSIPYDRATTSMACFPLCEHCQAEYDDPLNRRFHAQPNACPQCGPKIWYAQKDAQGVLCSSLLQDGNLQDQDALQALCHALYEGKIAAVKGLGGFHLVCHAFDENAIARLRQLKNRPHKPLAIMVESIEVARSLAYISLQEEALLLSQEKPIVLCKRREKLPKNLAPDTNTIGLVLPYTPFHVALFKHLHAQERTSLPLALVMTSGNASGEPICLGNREAVQRLALIADVFLFHNRDILVRNDDSVRAVHYHGKDPQDVFLRRARGYVPRPTFLSQDFAKAPCVLGMGAELKNTLCLTRGHAAFMSQHVGDLQNIESLNFYREVLAHLEMLLQVQGQIVVHDAHPDFLSTRVAQELAAQRQIPIYALQHHFAHAYAVLAEHGDMEHKPCLALSLDGTGYGLDGTIWGGELLYIDGVQHERLGRLSPFALPGGEQAIREPWRIAMALAQGTDFEAELLQKQSMGFAVLEMVAKNIRSPLTSSAGRLFDGVAAGLGLCDITTYEGQAAIRLEHAQENILHQSAERELVEAVEICKPYKRDNLWELSSQQLFLSAMQRAKQANCAAGAALFHGQLAEGFANMVELAAKERHVCTVALCGGVMQNKTLYALLVTALQERGMSVLSAQNVPCNDGGISLGQIFYGLLQWQEREKG